MKKMYKVWRTGDPMVYYVEKDSMDEAFAEVRKIRPDADSAQMCTEEEARRIRDEKAYT